MACGSDEPDVARDPNQSREDVHAATGHEPAPADCTNLTGEPTAVVVQRATTFQPDCLIVSGAQQLTVRNESADPHTFTVVDPPGGVNPRHILIDLEARAGGGVAVGVGETLGPGSYPFYCRFHQAEGMSGTMIVRS